MYDVAIVGTGPAGLSAAINLKLHEKDFIWFGSNKLSDKVEKSEKIANLPGMGFVSGKDLNNKFTEHMKELDIKPEDKMVTTITKTPDGFTMLADNEMYQAKTLILTTGVVAAKGFEGEEEMLGRGVSYCATCDGFLYKGKTIAVFCGSKRYEGEVEYLAKIAEKVYVSAPYKDYGVEAENVEKVGPIKRVFGEMRVTGIELADGSTVDVDGLFCLRNAVSPSTLLKGLELDGPHIVTDKKQATNIDGCFAAGDCTGRPYQLTKAMGEGNVAAHSVLDYLNDNK